MRSYRLVVFGREWFSWEIDGALEVVINTAEPEVEPEVNEEGYEEADMVGGSVHDFERDLTPLDPNDRYDWEFGFHPGER